ncbi:MAG: hypothetical protein HYR60_17110 [Acidobacteria bacterium]|nr:hypothetical protein [Acidobacteriota bacterium]
MRARSRVPLALAVLLLAGCQPAFRLALASAEERIPRPRFVVEDPARPGQAPRFHTIKALDASGAVIWHLRAEPFDDRHGVSGLVYGEAPAGFATIAAAAPLKAGEEYALVVIGIPYGSLRFRVDSDGRVR